MNSFARYRQLLHMAHLILLVGRYSLFCQEVRWAPRYFRHRFARPRKLTLSISRLQRDLPKHTSLVCNIPKYIMIMSKRLSQQIHMLIMIFLYQYYAINSLHKPWESQGRPKSKLKHQNFTKPARLGTLDKLYH